MSETTGTLLLTGATGFLGAFLAAELLAEGGELACLVRGADLAEGAARVRQSLSARGLWRSAFADQIHPVLGDLNQPGLGMDAEARRGLAAGTSAIIHAAANTSFLWSYSLLSRTNVEGTRQLLELATAAGAAFHYVGSISVFLSSRWGGRLARELDVPELDELPDSWGYPKTKLAAELSVREAGRRGLKTTIFRPWFVGPHTVTGVAANDLKVAMIQGCLELGAAPPLDLVINMAPVDFVARAMVHLIRAQGGGGRTYHLGNPRPTTFAKVTEEIAGLGLPLAALDYPTWRRDLRARPDNPAYVFTPLMPTTLDALDARSLLSRMAPDRVPCTDTSSCDGALPSELRCVPFEGDPLRALLRRRGWLPDSAAAGSGG